MYLVNALSFNDIERAINCITQNMRIIVLQIQANYCVENARGNDRACTVMFAGERDRMQIAVKLCGKKNRCSELHHRGITGF